MRIKSFIFLLNLFYLCIQSVMCLVSNCVIFKPIFTQSAFSSIAVISIFKFIFFTCAQYSYQSFKNSQHALTTQNIHIYNNHAFLSLFFTQNPTSKSRDSVSKSSNSYEAQVCHNPFARGSIHNLQHRLACARRPTCTEYCVRPQQLCSQLTMPCAFVHRMLEVPHGRGVLTDTRCHQPSQRRFQYISEPEIKNAPS